MRTWASQVSSVSTDTLCHPWSFSQALHVAGAPWKSEPLPSTCPGPHASCTCPSPHSQPRWSLPGQLSCLPHASAAPRTGLCKNPAGQSASKPGSSWDAQGHRGMGGVVLPWRPNTSVHVWGEAAWGSEDRELEERSPGQESPTMAPH